MSKPITAFVPFSGQPHTTETVRQLRDSGLVEKVFLLKHGAAPGAGGGTGTGTGTGAGAGIDGCEVLPIDPPWSSQTMRDIANATTSSHALLFLEDSPLELGEFAVQRFFEVAQSTAAGCVYSDYWQVKRDMRSLHPVTEYQLGSVRDDFDFGTLLLLDAM